MTSQWCPPPPWSRPNYTFTTPIWMNCAMMQSSNRPTIRLSVWAPNRKPSWTIFTRLSVFFRILWWSESVRHHYIDSRFLLSGDLTMKSCLVLGVGNGGWGSATNELPVCLCDYDLIHKPSNSLIRNWRTWTLVTNLMRLIIGQEIQEFCRLFL